MRDRHRRAIAVEQTLRPTIPRDSREGATAILLASAINRRLDDAIDMVMTF